MYFKSRKWKWLFKCLENGGLNENEEMVVSNMVVKWKWFFECHYDRRRPTRARWWRYWACCSRPAPPWTRLTRRAWGEPLHLCSFLIKCVNLLCIPFIVAGVSLLCCAWIYCASLSYRVSRLQSRDKFFDQHKLNCSAYMYTYIYIYIYIYLLYIHIYI